PGPLAAQPPAPLAAVPVAAAPAAPAAPQNLSRPIPIEMPHPGHAQPATAPPVESHIDAEGPVAPAVLAEVQSLPRTVDRDLFSPLTWSVFPPAILPIAA